jgi:hypothetical protein
MPDGFFFIATLVLYLHATTKFLQAFGNATVGLPFGATSSNTFSSDSARKASSLDKGRKRLGSIQS